jgi:hypothetical protein
MNTKTLLDMVIMSHKLLRTLEDRNLVSEEESRMYRALIRATLDMADEVALQEKKSGAV